MAERTHSVRLRLELDQLRRDAAEATKSIGGIGAAAADAGRQSRAMDLLGNAARGVGRTLAGVGTVAAGAMAALTVSTVATGISYNTLEQSTRAALTTLLGGAEAATQQMDELREFVRTALFPREAFIEGQQQLLAFGTAAERVIPILDAVQNAVAATGGSAQTFREVIAVLAEVQSTGQITAGVLNELGRRGINAAELIGQAMGQTETEIRESISSGALDGREALELLVTAMEDRFAGAAALISNTWTGARGLVTAALRDIGSATVEAFIDPAGGGAAILWAQNLAEVLFALEGQIRDVVAIFRNSADPTFERWGDLLLELAQRINEFDVDALIDRLRDGAPALAALGAAAAAAGGQAALAATGMGTLAGAISPLGAAITAAAIASPELRQLLLDLFEALRPLLPVILETGTALASVLSTGLGVVAELLQPLVPLIEALVDMFTSLPGPVQQATVAVVAFSLALRFAGPVGVAVTALAVLGATVQSLGELFGEGEQAARGWQSTIQETQEDLHRLATTGRVTGDLENIRDIFEELDDALQGTHDSLNFFERELKSASDLFDSVGGDIPNLLTSPVIAWGRSLTTTGDQMDQFRQRLEPLDEALGQMVASGDTDLAAAAFDRLALKAALAGVSQDKLLELLPEYVRQMERHEDATGESATGQGRLADETLRATEAMREQADEVRAQTDPIFALFDALSDVEEAQQAYNDVLGDSEASQRDVEQAARDLFEATVGLEGAAVGAGGKFDGKLTPAMRNTLEAANLTEDQIAAIEEVLKDTKDALDGYEGRYEAIVQVTGAEEAGRIARNLKRNIEAIPKEWPTTVTVHQATTLPGRGPIAFAHGGGVDGPTGVDRVPALLTRGEHIWTVQEVEAAGGHQAVEALRAAVLGQASRFAVGGPVGVPRMQAGGAVDAAMAAGINIENLNLRAFSGHFSLAQIEAQMRMYQQAIAFDGAS